MTNFLYNSRDSLHCFRLIEKYRAECTKTNNTVSTTSTTQGSNSLAYKKFQDFPGSLNFYPALCHSPAMLNYTRTAVTYFLYTMQQYNSK